MKRATAQRRVNYRSGNAEVLYRVDGTAAYAPRVAATGEVAAVSAVVEKNRAKALAVGGAYVFFIALISAASVFMCIRYLRMKSVEKSWNEANEKLLAELYSMRSENDALLENVNNSVDWVYIRDRAVNDFGMKYASKDQIVWYNTDDSYYIRQYCDVPR